MTLKDIANQIGSLVEEKNIAYGNSFVTSGEILKIMYPNGIKPEQITDMLLTVRILDKLSRIANGKGSNGESEWRDLAGYGICGAFKDEVKPEEPIAATVPEGCRCWECINPNVPYTHYVPPTHPNTYTCPPPVTSIKNGGWSITFPNIKYPTAVPSTPLPERCNHGD